MGLDITYYLGLQEVDAVFNADGEPIDPQTRKPLGFDYYQPIPNPHYERDEGLVGKIYRFDETDGFRAGSYGGYNQWRDELAKLAGYPPHPREKHSLHQSSACEVQSGPFWELLTFSDCEGTIGPKIATKLAKDFAY
jgi:hypothetical protein